MEYGQGEEGSESLPSIALRHTDDLRLVGHRTAVVGRCHGLSAKAKRSRFLWTSPFWAQKSDVGARHRGDRSEAHFAAMNLVRSRSGSPSSTPSLG